MLADVMPRLPWTFRRGGVLVNVIDAHDVPGGFVVNATSFGYLGERVDVELPAYYLGGVITTTAELEERLADHVRATAAT